MKYRVHQLATLANMSAKEVIAQLQDKGEYVSSASSAVAEPVARAFLAAQGVPLSKPRAQGPPPLVGNKAIPAAPTPPTTYGWHANPVPPPKGDDVQRKLSELFSTFPEAREHNSMLQSLGSQFVFANTTRSQDGRLLGLALARFSGAIEAAFGITREIMFFYSPYYDVQIRTFMKAKETLAQVPREATPDLIFFSAPDQRLAIKLADWCDLSFRAIPLPSAPSEEPIELIRLLRDHVYARDLFYETTPVHGQRFFGRKALLQELRDDIQNQRVSGVFGLRKSGKTSVLLELSSLVSQPTIVPVFIDLEVLPSPPSDPTPQLVTLIATQLRKQLQARDLPTGKLDALRATPSPEELKYELEKVLSRLEKKGITIVLLFDEIEFLTPSDQLDIAEGGNSGVAQTLGALRSVVQSTKNFTFLLAGLTNVILESGRLFGRPNPLFSWAKARYIGPFSRSEADELARAVGARMGIEIEEAALASLYDVSGGHAYLYRNLASAVVGRLPVDSYRRVMTHRDVLYALVPWKRSIAGNLDEILGHLERYYPVEFMLMEALMDAPEWFTELAVGEDQALHHLVSLGLVSENVGRFEPSSLLELRWSKTTG